MTGEYPSGVGQRRLTRSRRNGFTFVPEAEIYPLVLSVGIFIQSFIFAGAQSTGLDSLWGLGCTWLAQLMLPGKSIENPKNSGNAC
jgi:hypothetical protein